MAMVGLVGVGIEVACREMPVDFSGARRYTDDTRLLHHPALGRVESE